MVSGRKFEHKNIATLPHARPAGKGPMLGREVILRARTIDVTVTHVILVTEPRLTEKKKKREAGQVHPGTILSNTRSTPIWLFLICQPNQPPARSEMDLIC